MVMATAREANGMFCITAGPVGILSSWLKALAVNGAGHLANF